MALNTAKRIMRKASPEDESSLSLEGPNALGVDEPQQELEKVVIPDGGEVHLQNTNILPDSVAVTDLRTDKEFVASENQTLEQGQYFLLPEDGTLFFHPSDAGARVQINYLWKEGIESDDDEDEDDLDDDADEDDGDNETSGKKPRVTTTPADSLWHLDEGWFKWTPESKKVTVNDSLQAKLGTDVDFRKGITVRNEQTGKELHVVLQGAPTQVTRTISGKKLEINLRRPVDSTSVYVESAETGDRFTPVESPANLQPNTYYVESDVGVLRFHEANGGTKVRIEFRRPVGPGEVSYNYVNGVLTWGDPSASGTTYVVEYHVKGQKGKPLTLEGEEGEEKEYQLVESFKSRAENLWMHLLDNPDPAFVRDTLLPIIEDEIESTRDKILGSKKSEPQKEEELRSVPDLTREFMEFEQLLAKREENDDQDTRELARDYVQTEIAPKLARFYSLASLLAERIYDMQSESAKDEDFPEFGGAGSRSLDLNTLKYLKRVRQEANRLDEDLVDFSKYYTGLLISWILDADTYYPSKKAREKKKGRASKKAREKKKGRASKKAREKKKGRDPRWEGIKTVFERAGIGLADLQVVALEAFRRAILEFDRERRNKETTPDPKKFRIYGNPVIKRRVTNALKKVFDKYQQEQTVETTRSGSTTVTIPEDGGEVDLKVPGIRLEDLEVTGPDGKVFTSASGKLFATEAEKRKSPRVKILLGKEMDKDAQVSVTDPKTGKKLAIIRSKDHPWNKELKKKVAEDPDVFYFAHSSGTLWLSEAYRGKSLLVEAPGIGGDSTGIGKDQYRAHPTKGTIEFSPLNGGEEVKVSYSQTIRAKRQVSPVVRTDEEGESLSLVEMQEDEGADPLTKAEEAISQENVEKLLDLIGEILLVEEDPRLTDEDRAILQGLLGVGEPGGQRLTIQEIAAREPFNVDPSDSNKMNQIKTKRQKAADTLLEILREKAEEDRSLRKMIRPFEAILVGKDGAKGIEHDKFLGYLKQAPEDKTRSFQQVLVGLLGKSGLKQDEENILRWMWALPGRLRRDQDAEDKQYEVLPDGLRPADSPGARLQEIAIDEFNIEADDQGNISQAATGVVNKVYERALDKFAGKFNTVYEARKDFFKEKFPEFVQYYDKQLGKQTLRDELSTIERDEYQAPPAAVKRPEEKRTPLFDQIKTSLSGVDEAMLRSLMEELVKTHKKGGDIHALIQQREKDIDTLTQKGAKLLDSRTKDLRAEVEELKKAWSQSRAEHERLSEELSDALRTREKLRETVVADNEELAKKKTHFQVLRKIIGLLKSWETSTLFQLLSPKNIEATEDPVEQDALKEYSYLRNASNEDLEEAREDLANELTERSEELKELRRQAVELADEEVRTQLRQLKEKIEDLRSRKEKFLELTAKQQAALDSKKDELEKKLRPLQNKLEEHLRSHNSAQELQVLQKVYKFLSDREELRRSDGRFNLDNMFEVPKLEKGKGYQPPKLQPGEEDTYQPLPRKLPQPAISTPKKTAPVEEDAGTPASKPASKTLKTIAEQYTKDEISAEIFIRRCKKYFKGRLPEEAESAIQRYDEGLISLDEAANIVATEALDAIEDVEPASTDEAKKKPTEEDSDRFTSPAKKAPTEVQRTLFEELRSVALPIDPEESKKDYQKRLDNFKGLMLALRKHFAEGQSIKTFKPKFSAAKTLPDQNRVLRAVVEYLRDFASDLKQAPGVWDLSGLFKPTITKPVESLQPKVDLSDDDSAVESLLNSQPSLSNKTQAKALHSMIQIINNGDPVTKIIKSLRKTGNPKVQGALNLALRLSYFMTLHEDLQKEDGTWDFKPLYTGQYKFPSFEEYDRSRPLEEHLSPLIDGIQRQLQEEAGPDGGIESRTGTQQRVLDLLHQMSELALHGMDLDQMQEHFEKEDKREAKPYSLAYLFQVTRHFLEKLNRTKGLANMQNDMGLADVFGPGAPPSTPTEQDEVDPVPEQEQKELLPQDDRTTAFRQMVHVMDMDEAEARVAQQLVSALQLRMESGTKVASELLEALLRKNPKFLPIVKKVLTFIGRNREKFESGVPGVPDLSILTGMPFKHPAVEKTPEKAVKPEVQQLLQEKSTPAPESQRKKLRKSIFDEFVAEYELDDQQKNLFADAIRALKAHEGKAGIEKLVGKTEGTQLEGVFELLVDFFKEKGLVGSDGVPDFRGISVPPLSGRESFFAEDGTPNLGRVEEQAPEFDADEISDEMPEPKADLEEHTEDLVDELGGEGARFAPDLQEAVDFLKSDQVVTEEDSTPRSKSKDRLKRNIWNLMVQEFDFDEEEQQNAAEILEAVQKNGLDKVKAQLSGQGHLEVLLDDLIDYIKEQGLQESDIPDIELPAAPDAEDTDDVGMTIEELMGEKPVEKAPARLAPTIRREVDEETLQKVLEEAQKVQGKDERLFDSSEVVRGLEGKIAPEDAKNALLQAAEQGLVDLRAESGAVSLSPEDAKFVPVSPDGVPFSSGRVLRMPEPAAAPQPAEPAPAPGKAPSTRGRLPAALVDRETSSAVYTFVVKHSGLTPDEINALNEAMPGLENMTYRQVAEAFRKNHEQLGDAAKNAALKYIKNLTAYLRLVQQGKDPVGGPPASSAKRPKGQWRDDPATEKQIAKLQELAHELQSMGHSLPPVSLSPTTKGEASDGLNALRAALDEAKKSIETKQAPPAQTKEQVRADRLHELLSKDRTHARRVQRLRALIDLGSFTAEEISQAVSRLEVADKEKADLLGLLPGAAPARAEQPKAPQKSTAPSGATPDRNERKRLQLLLEKALEWSTAHEVTSAHAFRLFLKKKRPELLPMYDRIMPDVQKALDAIYGNELDFDLSGI